MSPAPSIASAEAAARSGTFYIVLNASSGRNDAQAQQRIMAEVLTAGGRAFEFLEIPEPSLIAEVAIEAVQRAQGNGGIVVAAGGDGTINAVASAVLGSGCPFGVLPQGTFNYFGRAHAIAQDTGAATQALLSAQVQPVQVGQVNNKLFLVNASLGLYPQLLEDREAWKKQLGRSRLVAFAAGLATLAKARHQLQLEVETGGHITLLRTPTLFVGNNQLQLEQVGIDEHHAEAIERGELAAITLKPIGSWALYGLLLRGLAGRLGQADNVNTFSFRRLTVRPRGVKRIKVATDGEINWMPTPLVFKPAPDALLLMAPAAGHRVEVA